MKHLRVAFIQDSVVLRLAYPTHPLWKCPIFYTEEYQRFAASAIERLRVPEPETLITSIRQAMPVMSNVVDTGFKTIDRPLTALESGVQGIRGEISKIVRGGVRLVFNDTEDMPSDQQATCSEEAETGSYVMSRALKTVVDVWNEYTVGLGGGPSIRELDERFGASRRSTDSEQKFYSRRKIFYSLIDHIATTKGSLGTEIAEMLESTRVNRRKTLDGLRQELKEKDPLIVYEND